MILIILGFVFLFFTIAVILNIVDSFTEVISCERLVWSTFTKSNQCSYLRLKRIKFFDYYYIEEDNKYSDCKSHPDYTIIKEKLQKLQYTHKNENLDKLW